MMNIYLCSFLCVLFTPLESTPPKRDSVIYDTELIPDKMKSRLHPKLASLVDAQARLDSQSIRFAPNLDYEIFSDSKIHYEYTPLGRLTLNERIGQSRHSAVFTTVENPDLIIKYQSNCERELLPHPLLLDFWGLSQAARKNVSQVPRVHFVSPAVRAPIRRTTKCDFQLSDSAWPTCANSKVRFIVMERLGPSVYGLRFMIPMVPRRAVQYGIELMDAVKGIHAAGLLHGDIHSGNVLVDKEGRVKLIDFDRFQFDPGFIRKTHNRFQRNHPFFSPWEMEGYAPSSRDDIFRAISVISELFNPLEAYREFLFSRSAEDLYIWKMKGHLFSAMPTRFMGDNWGVSDPLLVARLNEIFSQILFVTRTGVVKFPDTYDSISNLLKRVDWILTHSVA